MRWTLFWVFIILFILLVILTMIATFFDVGSLSEVDQSLLVKGLLVELGLAVFALFYAVFGLRNPKQDATKTMMKVRIGFPEMVDVRGLVGRKASCSFIGLTELEREPPTEVYLLDDNGPMLTLIPPPGAAYVIISIQLEEKMYSGSFALDSRIVDLEPES